MVAQGTKATYSKVRKLVPSCLYTMYSRGEDFIRENCLRCNIEVFKKCMKHSPHPSEEQIKEHGEHFKRLIRKKDLKEIKSKW